MLRNMSSSAYVPPGWPSQVRPPGAQGWEATAIAYLLDCCPPDFRAYRVLRNHPVVLAEFASHFVDGQHEAAQRGLAGVRTSLSEYVEPDVVAPPPKPGSSRELGWPVPAGRSRYLRRLCAAGSSFASFEGAERGTCAGPHLAI